MQKLGGKFIRIDPDKEGLNIFKTDHEIFRYIKRLFNQLNKKNNFAEIVRIKI